MSIAMVQRRLAAILVADLVGYSRMIRDDELKTITEIQSLLSDLLQPSIEGNGGRVVKTMGDGLLAEFSSVVAATASAAHIQSQLAARNGPLPPERRLVFRIGVNLGDVIAAGEDIHGDGVNVAARLEGIAPAGGIAISQAVHDQVCNRLEMSFDEAGPQSLKNIDTPIPVWTWAPSEAEVRRANRAEPETSFGEADDRPSIAVLPFENMSGDAEQDYFADGIADDIITALSRSPWLFVIARNSSFTYRGATGDIRQVASELGVRLILQGAVRKAGNRVRINVQLVRGDDGRQVWAERYDGQLEDIFDLQDEITGKVVGSLHAQIMTNDDTPTARSGDHGDVQHWVLMRQVWKPFFELTPAGLEQAGSLAEKVLETKPDSSEALWALAGIRFHQVHLGYRNDPDGVILHQAQKQARASVDLEDRNEFAHWTAGLIHLYLGDYASAVAEMERSIELNGNFSLGYGSLATVLAYAGDADRSIENNMIAMRLNPRDPSLFLRHAGLALAHFTAGRFDQAALWAQKVVVRRPEYDLGHGLLIASLSHSGQTEAAAAAREEFLSQSPQASVSGLLRIPLKQQGHRDLLAEGLREAGLPEGQSEADVIPLAERRP